MQLSEKTKLVVRTIANRYLAINSTHLTPDEKDQFNKDLDTWLLNDDAPVSDNLRDFLVDINIINNQPQVDDFMNFLRTQEVYKNAQSVLEVGTTRTCPLGRAIALDGKDVTALSPNIRLTDEELKERGIAKSLKQGFVNNGVTTDVSKYDLVVAIAPSGHIKPLVEQCTNSNKPFFIALSANEKATKALDGFVKIDHMNTSIYTNDTLDLLKLEK